MLEVLPLLVLLDPLPSIVAPKCAPPDAPTSPVSGSTCAWAAPATASSAAEGPTNDRFQTWFTSITASESGGFSARRPMHGRVFSTPNPALVRRRLYTASWVSQRSAASFCAPLTCKSVQFDVP